MKLANCLMLPAVLLGLTGAVVCGGPAVAQKSSDIVRIAQSQTVPALDAYLDPRPEVYFLSDAVFDTLISYDSVKKEFVPLLAKSWKRIDGRTLEFELREDVVWHDGHKFSADDVVYTIEWLTNPQTKLRFASYYSWIERVEKTTHNIIRIISRNENPSAIAMLASPNVMPIMPRHIHGALNDKFEFGKAPVGTGPYKVVSLNVDKGVVLLRNETYVHANGAKSAGKVRHIHVRAIPDVGTRAAEMMVGNIELMRDLPIDMAENLAGQSNFAATVTVPIGSSYLLIDAKGRSGKKRLQDARVRRAIMMAINGDDLGRMTAGRTKSVARPHAMCNRAQQGCDYSLQLPAFDLAGARKLLAEAGYAGGFDVTITAPSVHSGLLAQVLSGRLREIGIRAEIDTLTFAGYRAKQMQGKIELLVNGWGGGGMADVQATLDFFFAPGGTDYFGLPRLTELARASAVEMDDTKRRSLVRELFDAVTEIAYMAPIAAQPAFWVHSKDIAITGDFTFSAWGLQSYQIGWR